MIKYSELRDKIQLKSEESDENDLANLTHYLQNLPNGVSDLFEEPVKKYLTNVGFDQLSEPYFQARLPIEWDVPFPPPSSYSFTFIDLFAGIGGFRIALQNLNGKCVFSSEIDKYSQKTYEANFGEVPFGDIKKICESDIPDHDLLAAGFPCQAFSIAGKKGGFNDTRGTLFFDIARIINRKRPKVFFLENVKGLVNHRSGKTLNTIINVLRNELNYNVTYKLIDSRFFGVPQKRERVFIVGFRKDIKSDKFNFPESNNVSQTFSDVKENHPVSAKYYVSSKYLNSLREHKKRHVSKGNGFGFEIISDDQIANAIVVGGMGKERNLVFDKRLKDHTPVTNIKGEINREGIRRMTPREWARLQGFPDNFKIAVSDGQAYKQFGNSVTIPAVEITTKYIIDKL